MPPIFKPRSTFVLNPAIAAANAGIETTGKKAPVNKAASANGVVEFRGPFPVLSDA